MQITPHRVGPRVPGPLRGKKRFFMHVLLEEQKRPDTRTFIPGLAAKILSFGETCEWSDTCFIVFAERFPLGCS